MNINTGNISFLLYGFFILLIIVAMTIASYFVLNGRIESKKLEKVINLFKYAIVSTSITTITLIITDLFKEREQALKEIQYFESSNLIKADGVESRLKLAKYLSIVAPNGQMKNAWKSYYDSVKVEYKEYLKLKEEIQKLDTITRPDANIDNKIQKLERIMLSTQ